MILLLLAALALSIAIGYFLAVLFLPKYSQRWADVLLKVSLGAGLGVGVSSSLYFLVWLIIGPSTVIYLVCELLTLAIAIAACRFRRERSLVDIPHAKPAGWTWLLLPAFLVTLALAVSLFVATSTASPYGEWDAWSIWNLRAEFLAQPDTSWRNAFSPLLNRPAGGGATHPDYPLLLSAYVGRCWNLTNSSGHPATPIAVAALFFFATVALAMSALAILRSWSAAMIGGMVLLGTAGFLLDGPWQYADIPLGFYYLAALGLFFLADAAPQNHGKVLVLAGLVMGLAAWTKNEGLVFALVSFVALIGYLWTARRSALLRSAGQLFAGAAVPLIIALYFKFFLAPPTGTYAGMTPAAAVHRLAEFSRYAEIGKAFWKEVLALGTGIAHPAVALAVLGAALGVAPDRRRAPVVITSIAIWIAVLIAYLATYAVTPLDLTWHLSTSMGRLLDQLLPSFIFLALAMFRTVEETAVALPQPVKTHKVTGKRKKKARAV
ncbi:MAG TPA: hypothetical protein VJN43_23010 [Bryobacteraceae bacterium]|nr:hypothetical protein [Bryobacteraceae bacterium]